MLATLLQILVPVLIRHNAVKVTAPRPDPIAFVKATPAGAKTTALKTAISSRQPRGKSLLNGANDWQLLIDFDCHLILFPTNIVATSERPDVNLWSTSTKTVLMFELTCPAEENFIKANVRKMDRYAPLCEQIRNAGWTPVLRTIEAGARGFVSHRFQKAFRELGLTSKETSTACKDISSVTARCSYGIWLMRKTAIWNASRELVVPNHFLQPAPTTTPTPLLASQPTKGNCDWHLGLTQNPTEAPSS